MIYWKKEGTVLNNGLHVYHPNDNSSLGVLLRIGTRVWRARYSKLARKWFFTYNKSDPNALKEWEEEHGLKRK